MQKNNKVTIYLILVIIIVALIIGGIVIAKKQGKKQTKESETNNTINTTEKRTKDYDYDDENPEEMYEAYNHQEIIEDETGIYVVTKDEIDFE